MKWAFSVIFLCAYSLEIISASDDRHSDCRLVCPNGQSSSTCPCYSPRKMSKRETVQERIKKIRDRKVGFKNVKLISTQRPKNLNFEKRFHLDKLTTKPNTHSLKTLPTYKELQDRFREFQARISAKPLLRARANFDGNNKPNIIEQFKSRQEELMEKFKKMKTSESLTRFQNRIDSEAPKVGLKHEHFEEDSSSVTTKVTEPIKTSSVIILSTSTTPSLLDVTRIKQDNDSSPLQKIKEKRKEVVTKIMDKISTTVLLSLLLFD
ncbi:hypothetical protein ABEB36_003697 [Hypothenemus hampei]|uniref:Uncharacterized protein n=1 Tax=Hypothenemus hampei TaxID=57062 RepID=A0ABD1F0U3_HYPHA